MIWCLLTSFEYIESLINVIEQHLSVYLRYLNIGVAEHLRHHRYRNSAVQCYSGEGMAAHVRRQMRNKPLASPHRRSNSRVEIRLYSINSLMRCFTELSICCLFRMITN